MWKTEENEFLKTVQFQIGDLGLNWGWEETSSKDWGQWKGHLVQGLIAKAANLNWVSCTHKVEESRLLPAVLWPPYEHRGASEWI